MSFPPIALAGGTKFVGSNTSAIDGRVVAELTMREFKGSGLNLLATTLTIYPPLTDLNNVDLNNTNIMCVGTNGSKTESAVVSIVLEGEKQKI